MGIKTYLGGQVAPHCLRRTFGTCNVDPLGLCLDIAFIAGRLRNGIEITYRHYIQDNPLLQEYKATEIKARARVSGKPKLSKHDLIDALLEADIHPATIRLV